MSIDESATSSVASDAAGTLRAHPWLAGVRVQGGTVHVRPAPSTLALRPRPGPLLREFLQEWTQIYNWVYQRGESRHADDLDLSGWRASDTGRPLSTEHMTDWVERTVELVLGTGATTILELGVGTGLLLHRLHRQVSAYVGLDQSATAVARLSALRLPGVAAVHAAAHEASSPAVRRAIEQVAGPGARPDCVLLNSVIQYFPGVDYLENVLRDAIGMVAPGGTVIVGDVRHHGLFDHYCRWLERTADPDATGEEVAFRAAARAAREGEMLVDPRVLAAIAARSGRTVRIALHAKTMREATELTRYRYDAVLHVDPPDHPTASRVPWHTLPEPDRLTALPAYLREHAPVIVEDVPNALLRTDDPDAPTASRLHELLDGTGALVGVSFTDPTALRISVPGPAGAEPAADVPVPAGSTLAHEPLMLFLNRRVPELLHDYLRRVDAEQANVPVVVE